MQLTSGHYWAIFLTLGLVLLVGASAVRKVKGSKDFTMGGNQIGTAGVIGILLGTILGGASTIGTSQLAFSKGISAVWFSLGCSVGLIGIAILSPRLCKIPRVNTIPQILCRRYGKMIRPIFRRLNASRSPSVIPRLTFRSAEGSRFADSGMVDQAQW